MFIFHLPSQTWKQIDVNQGPQRIENIFGAGTLSENDPPFSGKDLYNNSDFGVKQAMNHSVDRLNLYHGDTTARSQEVDSLEQLTANQSDFTKYGFNSTRDINERGRSPYGKFNRRRRHRKKNQ